MAAPSAAMTRFYPPRPDERTHLPRKLVLLFLLVTALALGLTLLFREKPGYPAWLQTSLAAGSMGAVSAIGSRLVLRKRNIALRFLAALANLMLGLFVLGMATEWKHGIGPLILMPRIVDWYGIVQVAIGTYVLLLVFRAWNRQPRQVIEVEPRSIEPQIPDLPPGRRPVPARYVRRTIPREAHLSRHGIALTNLFPPADSHAGARAHTGRCRKPAIRTLSVADLPVRPRRRGRNRKARVQFAVVEEHRCPFCLETVNRVDPRGVVECDVCHALHHKDCWNITGICQVPHLNS